MIPIKETRKPFCFVCKNYLDYEAGNCYAIVYNPEEYIEVDKKPYILFHPDCFKSIASEEYMFEINPCSLY